MFEEMLQFRPNNHQESDDSGVCSPPLWKNSPSPSPSRSPSHPLLAGQNNSYKCCSSQNSRAKAIARGQRELMEMVKNMPESSYELSLKDLVEHHNMENSNIRGPQVQNIGTDQILQKGAVFVEVMKGKKSNFEISKGLFIKMGFPFNLQQSKKIKNKFGDSNNSSGEVSPKAERDWWKKKFTGSSDSDSSRISSNSGGGSSSGRSYGGGASQRKKQGFLRGCWPFFQSRSSKSVE